MTPQQNLNCIETQFSRSVWRSLNKTKNRNEAYPKPSLGQLVHRYLFFDTEKDKSDHIPILPTGFIYLNKCFGKPANVMINGEQQQLPSLFLGGQVSKSLIEIIPKGRVAHFAIEFHATGFYRLFGISPKLAYNNFLDFRMICDKNELIADVDDAFDLDEGFDLACKKLDELLEGLSSQQHSCEDVVEILKHMQDNKGKVNLTELASKFNKSTRQLRRRFKLICGISPQAYCKIIQLNGVIEAINSNDEQSLLDIAYDCGYFDTAHFINKFNQMIGRNPTAFMKSENQLVKTYMQLL